MNIMAPVLISPLTDGWGLVLATPLINGYCNDISTRVIY
jgi:hypothetical protein